MSDIKSIEVTRDIVITVTLEDDDYLPNNVAKLVEQRVMLQKQELETYIRSLIKTKGKPMDNYKCAMGIVR